MAFSIPSGIITTYQNVIDAVIRDLGKTITLVYPPKQMACVDCNADSIGAKTSNRYVTGMPVPTFKTVGCEYCGGTGYKSVEVTENLKVNIYWTQKDFIKTGVGVDLPDGTIAIRAFLTDLPKLERCDSILVHNDIVGYGQIRFQRIKKPVLQGLGIDRYIWMYWQRVT